MAKPLRPLQCVRLWFPLGFWKISNIWCFVQALLNALHTMQAWYAQYMLKEVAMFAAAGSPHFCPKNLKIRFPFIFQKSRPPLGSPASKFFFRSPLSKFGFPISKGGGGTLCREIDKIWGVLPISQKQFFFKIRLSQVS